MRNALNRPQIGPGVLPGGQSVGASKARVDGIATLGRHPKPAIDRHLKTGQRGAGRRDVDVGGGLRARRRDGQRLECRETLYGLRKTPGGRAGLGQSLIGQVERSRSAAAAMT